MQHSTTHDPFAQNAVKGLKQSTSCQTLDCNPGERAFEPLLLADTSAVFQDNRRAVVWQRIASESAWHPRFVHGSDYPLPGVWPLYNLEALSAARVLDPMILPALQSIRRRNVLLFDFVLKRQLRFGVAAWADTVFMNPRLNPILFS